MNAEDFKHFRLEPVLRARSRTFGWNSLRPVGAASLPCDAKLMSHDFGHMKSEQHVLKDYEKTKPPYNRSGNSVADHVTGGHQ
jgi:hypothetical protein